VLEATSDTGYELPTLDSLQNDGFGCEFCFSVSGFRIHGCRFSDDGVRSINWGVDMIAAGQQKSWNLGECDHQVNDVLGTCHIAGQGSGGGSRGATISGNADGGQVVAAIWFPFSYGSLQFWCDRLRDIPF
jgi:hypothetical protein